MFEFLKKKAIPSQPVNLKNKKRKNLIGNTQIAFEPGLIDSFIEEHKILISKFTKLELSVKTKQAKVVKEALSIFSKLLRAHLLKENLKLYVYLRHATSHDPSSSEVIIQYKKEMHEIGKTVHDFVTHYLSLNLNAEELKEMDDQLPHIKALLIQRITDEEETLYPLYMIPENYF